MDFIKEHWAEILLALIAAAGTITALTETTKDDGIVDLIKRIVNAVIMGRNK